MEDVDVDVDEEEKILHLDGEEEDKEDTAVLMEDMADIIVAALMSLRLCAREQSEDFEPPFKQKISGLNPLSVLSPLSFSLSFFLKKEDVCGSQTTFRRLFFFSRLFQRQSSLFCLLDDVSLRKESAARLFYLLSHASLSSFFIFWRRGGLCMPFFLFLRGRTKEGDIFGHRPHNKKKVARRKRNTRAKTKNQSSSRGS